jgi:hypothetical protein
MCLDRAEGSDRLNETVTLQLAQDVLHCLGRSRPRVRDLPDACRHDSPVDADLVQYKSIGRLGLDIPCLQSRGGKSLRFLVTITWAPDLIAAASTCLSLGSGSFSPSISGS